MQRKGEDRAKRNGPVLPTRRSLPGVPAETTLPIDRHRSIPITRNALTSLPSNNCSYPSRSVGAEPALNLPTNLHSMRTTIGCPGPTLAAKDAFVYSTAVPLFVWGADHIGGIPPGMQMDPSLYPPKMGRTRFYAPTDNNHIPVSWVCPQFDTALSAARSSGEPCRWPLYAAHQLAGRAHSPPSLAPAVSYGTKVM
jgi:hypothetical protein